jgi:protein involved in polysaccharide export with SLBB domain
MPTATQTTGRSGPLAAIALTILAGCATTPKIDQAVRTEGGRPERSEGIANYYTVACPDQLDVIVAGHPDMTGRLAVDSSGCLVLGSGERVRVDGRTVAEIERQLAERAEVPPGGARVGVSQFRSQQIYLYGKGVGSQRSVPYQGPETVLDLLQRVGGVTEGAAPNDVFVIRSHFVENQEPEVFRVDLKSVVEHHDDKSNVRLRPYDQVYVGETRQSTLLKLLPPCLRPLYRACCGLNRA